MEFYRKKIEEHLYKTNFYWHDGIKRLYEKDKYNVKYSCNYFKVERTFDNLEEAKIFNSYCINALAKAKYNKSKGVIDFQEQENVVVDEYPSNLLNELGINQDEDYYKIVLPYFETNFTKIKTCLSEREIYFVESYYKDLKTLEEIGKSANITRDRVRQLIVRALRKISIHKNIFYEIEEKMYLLDQETENKLIEEAREKINKETAIQIVKELIENDDEEVINELSSLIKNKPIKLKDNRIINKRLADLTIDELDFCVRTRNCLIRAGYETYKDIPFDDIERLMKIKNLGRKSLREIYLKKDELEGTKNSYEKALRRE